MFVGVRSTAGLGGDYLNDPDCEVVGVKRVGDSKVREGEQPESFCRQLLELLAAQYGASRGRRERGARGEEELALALEEEEEEEEGKEEVELQREEKGEEGEEGERLRGRGKTAKAKPAGKNSPAHDKGMREAGDGGTEPGARRAVEGGGRAPETETAARRHRTAKATPTPPKPRPAAQSPERQAAISGEGELGEEEWASEEEEWPTAREAAQAKTPGEKRHAPGKGKPKAGGGGKEGKANGAGRERGAGGGGRVAQGEEGGGTRQRPARPSPAQSPQRRSGKASGKEASGAVAMDVEASAPRWVDGPCIRCVLSGSVILMIIHRSFDAFIFSFPFMILI
jgi:hypothetical protein